MKHTIARMPGIVALALAVAAASASAAGITVEPLLRQRGVTALAVCDGVVVAGLDGGGAAVFAPGTPDVAASWHAGRDLSGNYVTSLAWTGRYLWVGTTGAGLTRVADPGGVPSFRQYAGNLAGLDITAVGGAVVGDAERVWYAVAGGGVGVITNGIAGASYTAERDGLVSNDIDAIALFGDAVFFASATGVSRFAGNVFTTVNAGLGNVHINGLGVGPDGVLYAVGQGGLYAWNPAASLWALQGTPGFWLNQVAWLGDELWTLGLTGGGTGTLARWDDPGFTTRPTPYAAAAALAGGDVLWTGGRVAETGMGGTSGRAWYARMDDAAGAFTTARLDAGPVAGDIEGVTFGADGTAWIGSRTAQAFDGLKDGRWTSVFELATAENDTNVLINHSGNMLALATDSDGMIWVTQYGSGGLLRHDPVHHRTDHVLTTNSGLSGRGVVQLAAHPAGPLLVMHDWQDAVKVEVLVDPARWDNPANWVALPTGPGGLGDGPAVWDAFVERNDVIWFTAEGTGLVRWDVNGDALGPDDTLTWTDPSDDRWDAPVTAFPGLDNDPTRAFSALERGPDGTIWYGGDGMVRFRYDADYRYLTVEDYLLVKTSPVAEGLLGGGVFDLALGRNGDLWVACLNGLNRVRMVQGEPVVDAWLDLMNYVGGADYATLYSPNVIEALPGFLYRKVVADPHSDRVLISSDRGAALVTPVGSSSAGSDPLASLYLAINPWNPDTDRALSLGGIDASAAEPADVTIYNLEGAVVYHDPEVAAGAGFWQGGNTLGAPVATGLYVVQVRWAGQTAVRTLAVVR